MDTLPKKITHDVQFFQVVKMFILQINLHVHLIS